MPQPKDKTLSEHFDDIVRNTDLVANMARLELTRAQTDRPAVAARRAMSKHQEQKRKAARNRKLLFRAQVLERKEAVLDALMTGCTSGSHDAIVRGLRAATATDEPDPLGALEAYFGTIDSDDKWCASMTDGV